MQKLLIVVDAPGPAEFILPVLPLIKKIADIRIVTVLGSPTAILAKYKPIRCDTPEEAEKIYRETPSDALLVAMSSLVTGPFVSGKFTMLAHADKKKVICFQDFWANHRFSENFKMMRYWDAVLTIDELAKNYLIRDAYEGVIYNTGSPAFDRFRKENVAKERTKLRKKYGIANNRFVILYAGAGTPAGWNEDEATFKFLSGVIDKFQKKYADSVFIARQHPRDEKPGRYTAIAPNLKYLETTSIPLSEDLLPIADVVIGMYATNLIHACYLRIPGISILLPNAGKKRLQENMLIPDFPPNSVGATIGIYEDDQEYLEFVLETLVNDPIKKLVLQTMQARFFQFEKEPSAKKVAAAIKKELK